jgi:hypothetical protein
MTDPKAIATAYVNLWNEHAADRRREIFKANWTPDATYVDPLMSSDGHDGVDALIDGVQQRFPDFKGHGFRSVEGWTDPEHHRIPRSGAARRLNDRLEVNRDKK